VTSDYSELFPESQIVNPFTFSYLQDELAFYGPITPSKTGKISFDTTTASGIMRDYLNKNWHEITLPIPRLKIGKTVFMSITPMEVQSLYLPIYEAAYDVYTGGLGLGYFALRAAAKEEVDRVIVYETDQRIINWFQKQFASRPELSKIEIRHADILEALRQEEIDTAEYVFNDIYPRMNTTAAIDHYCEFKPRYEGYRFWCMESVLLDADVTHGLNIGFVPPHFRKFFSYWNQTTVAEATGDTSGAYNSITLSQLYESLWTQQDCERFLEHWF